MLMVFVNNLEEAESYNTDLTNWTDDKVRLKHLVLRSKKLYLIHQQFKGFYAFQVYQCILIKVFTIKVTHN